MHRATFILRLYTITVSLEVNQPETLPPPRKNIQQQVIFVILL